MSSWRTSTKNKYNIYLNKWIDYCSTRDIDPFNATIKDGLCFLTYIFECEVLFQPFCLLVMAYLLANNIWCQNFAGEFFS